ncbi:kinase-like protein [Schizopora paradoxa]|uniref:Kinase-like protein n=1 Tax=Schizopora paradoxa TaxID=27342 RepID=A0A0H2RYC2_9AGAM|nr:kinase-like protein [Schizopora paradoxa]
MNAPKDDKRAVRFQVAEDFASKDSAEFVGENGTATKSEGTVSSIRLLDHVLNQRPDLNLAGNVFVDPKAVKSDSGGYADVFEGYLRLPTSGEMVRVAVKRLRMKVNEEKMAKYIAKEIRIWSEFNHPNILPLRGYFMEGLFPSLVSDWMMHGSLRVYREKLTRKESLSLMLGMARGLAYIHGKGAIHSDMKTDNVLVSPDKQPLLTDFGISRMDSLSAGYTSHSVRGTARWQAVEFFRLSDGPPPVHTRQTDVWAFGMTVYELLTKDRPFAFLKEDLHVILFVSQGRLPKQPTFSTIPDVAAIEHFMWSLCNKCWNLDPNLRPSMDEIEVIIQKECANQP